MKPDS